MKARYVNGAAEIVPGTEGVVARMGDYLVKKRLPGREVRIAGQRQQQPIGRVDKGRFFEASRIEAIVALTAETPPLSSSSAPMPNRASTASRCDLERPGIIFGDP